MSPPPQIERPAPPPTPRSVSSEELFQGHKMACIRHEGMVYRLLLTRNNRLILQR